MLRRHPWLSATGAIVAAALLVTFGVFAASDSSTAALAVVFVPLYALGGILLVLFVRLVMRTARVAQELRDDDRRV